MKKSLWFITIALMISLPAYGLIMAPVVGGGANGAVDGFLGNNTAADTYTSLDDSGDDAAAWDGQASQIGPINYCHAEVDFVSSQGNMAIYCNDAGGCTGGYSQGDVIRDGTLGSVSSGVNNITLDSEWTPTAGEDYRAVFAVDSSEALWRMEGNSGSGFTCSYETSFVPASSMPAYSADNAVTTINYRIWCDNTASGS